MGTGPRRSLLTTIVVLCSLRCFVKSRLTDVYGSRFLLGRTSRRLLSQGCHLKRSTDPTVKLPMYQALHRGVVAIDSRELPSKNMELVEMMAQGLRAWAGQIDMPDGMREPCMYECTSDEDCIEGITFKLKVDHTGMHDISGPYAQWSLDPSITYPASWLDNIRLWTSNTVMKHECGHLFGLSDFYLVNSSMSQPDALMAGGDARQSDMTDADVTSLNAAFRRHFKRESLSCGSGWFVASTGIPGEACFPKPGGPDSSKIVYVTPDTPALRTFTPYQTKWQKSSGTSKSAVPTTRATPKPAAPKQPATPKPAPKQSAPKQPATPKPITKQSAPKQSATPKPAPKQSAPKQSATPKPITKQAAPKQPAKSKPAPKQPAAAKAPAPKQSATPKPTPKKPAAKQAATPKSIMKQAAPKKAATPQPAAKQHAAATATATTKSAVSKQVVSLKTSLPRRLAANEPVQLAHNQAVATSQVNPTTCPQGGHVSRCCMRGRVKVLELVYHGCGIGVPWDSFRPAHLHNFDVNRFRVSVKAGQHLPNMYRICRDGAYTKTDCSTFDLSGASAFGAGIKIGNWQVTRVEVEQQDSKRAEVRCYEGNYTRPKQIHTAAVQCQQKCANGAKIATCCCDRGIQHMELLYLGCNEGKATHNVQNKMHSIATDSETRITITAQNGKLISIPNYRVCKGSDCGIFDLSCASPIQAGMRSGNWKLRTVNTLGDVSPVCPRSTQFRRHNQSRVQTCMAPDRGWGRMST